mmetsp:Transcript_3642/g.6201  ORF Transcript_3642/g.6201 Transcript_3642/m.6201 type:complete len:141 (-) Transcript_3642:51-473(-)
MLIGVTPFFNKNKNMLLTKIKSARVIFPDRNKYKIEYSDTMMDLISKLLEKDRSKRMGSGNDYLEVLSHPLFAEIDVSKLEKKELVAPFKPQINDEADLEKYFNVSNSKSAIIDTFIPSENRKIVLQNQDVFKDFNTSNN